MKQLGSSGNPQFKKANDIISNIAEKLKKFKGRTINLTKEEHEFLRHAVKETVSSTEKQIHTFWFGKRWVMKLMMKSYKELVNKLNVVK